MNSHTDHPNALPPVHTDTQEPPPLEFNVPDGFFALPLAETPEERAALAEEFVRVLYSRGDESIWRPAAPHYAGISGLLADTGISYSAVGLFSTAAQLDGESENSTEATVSTQTPAWNQAAQGVVQCAFTVAAVPTDQFPNDTEAVAQGILAALSSDPLNDARWLDLPCGPAVSCVNLVKYQLNPDVTATGECEELLTGQIQVHIPFPTGPFTAVFTLYTASTEYWREFCDIMAAVLQTVSFHEPGADLTETTDWQTG